MSLSGRNVWSPTHSAFQSAPCTFQSITPCRMDQTRWRQTTPRGSTHGVISTSSAISRVSRKSQKREHEMTDPVFIWKDIHEAENFIKQLEANRSENPKKQPIADRSESADPPLFLEREGGET